MSPDQYKSHPFVKRLIQTTQGLTQALPHVARYLTDPQVDFRGLTMFQGDNAEFVVGLRSYDVDGAPSVCWSSGDDPLFALINLDKAIGDGRFYPDKKEIARQSGQPRVSSKS